MIEPKTRVLTDQNGHTLRVIDNEFYALQAERDALAAQVGAFAAMIIESQNADESKDFLGSDWHKRSGDLMIASPKHHLAAHDAEVAKAAINDFANHLVDIGQIRSAYPAEEYTSQLRAKAKP